jgi:hypothetical protein
MNILLSKLLLSHIGFVWRNRPTAPSPKPRLTRRCRELALSDTISPREAMPATSPGTADLRPRCQIGFVS